MEIDERFAARLTQLRMAKGVSARDMSLSIGQSEGYINNIENKKNYPSMTNFLYICEYLNITPSEFFDMDNSDPEKLRDLISKLKKLDRNQIANISAIVDGLIR